MKTRFVSIVAGAVLAAAFALVLPQPVHASPSAQVTILGYHRFENPAKDPLAITTEEFRRQMQALKDAGIPVIPMEDFLAWRRGEKEIPERSAVITIDDGYNCTYHTAWPILKEFGYPFTYYVYTNYISAGGRSITWEQLKEMRAAGVDIGSHSISHDNMVRPKRAKGVDYSAWLRDELRKSKEIIEQNLGVPVRTFAYPYGIQNEAVRQEGLDAGYEALFTVAGKKISKDEPASTIGRYVIQSGQPQIFRAATSFGGAGGTLVAASAASGAPGLKVSPAHRETIGDDRPEIRAELGVENAIDPKTIEMRVSGLGQVKPDFDPATGVLRYKPSQRLHHRDITVSISTRTKGKKTETAWQFVIDPESMVPSAEQLAPPADPPTGAAPPASAEAESLPAQSAG